MTPIGAFKLIGLVTAPKLIFMVPQADSEFACSSAARNVHTPPAVKHKPSPRLASLASALLFTTNEPGQGTGVGVGVGTGVGVGVGVEDGQPFQLSLTVPASPPQPSTAILYTVPAVGLKVRLLVRTTPFTASSLNAI